MTPKRGQDEPIIEVFLSNDDIDETQWLAASEEDRIIIASVGYRRYDLMGADAMAFYERFIVPATEEQRSTMGGKTTTAASGS